MEKQIIIVEFDYDLEWDWGVEISQIRKDLDELEKLGATHIDIDSHTSYDNTYVTYKGYVEREETDEEVLKRYEQQKDAKYLVEKLEMAEYERLKLKYGS
jgi:hypothetical protein